MSDIDTENTPEPQNNAPPSGGAPINNSGQNSANEQNEGSSSGQSGTIEQTIQLRTPIFSEQRPDLWFIQLESYFSNARISADSKKFNIVVASVDWKILQQVQEIVLQPPESNKYTTLKNAIINRFSDSEQQKIQKFLTGMQLGDQRPSHFLNNLRQWANGMVDEKFLRSSFLQKLPSHVTSILAVNNSPLNELAEMADRILDFQPGGTVAQIENMRQKNNNSTSSTTEAAASSDFVTFQMFSNAINELSKKFDKLQRPTRSTNRGNYVSRGRSQTPRGRSTTPANIPTTCWYHRNYGTSSTKCKPPCDFPSASNRSNNNSSPKN